MAGFDHEDPALMPAHVMLERFAAGSLSPVEAVEAALARIERHGASLNPFVLTDPEGALAAARDAESRWTKNAPLGRLDGVPATNKDIILTKGWPTLRGSRLIDPNQPWEVDAPVTARLKEHGAVMLGKTTTPEFGWKGVTDSPLTGVTRNPWNLERTPGGSSGGAAAAAAAGMGALHVGTDAGGSVRIPAGFTGIVGLKPTYGRVPAWPRSPFGTLAHIGPMTRSVMDAALMLTVMAEPDHRDTHALPPTDLDYCLGLEAGFEGLRVAVSRNLGGHRVHPEIARLFDEALKTVADLGVVMEEAEPDLSASHDIFRIHWHAGAAKVLRAFTEEQRAEMDAGLVEVAEGAAEITLADYLDAMMARDALAEAAAEFFTRYDLLLTPTLPLPAFGTGQLMPQDMETEAHGPGDWPMWTAFSYPFNLTQQPALTVPCGLTDEGLPAGLQIVGRRFEDHTVLRAAYAFEQARPFALPDLS